MEMDSGRAVPSFQLKAAEGPPGKPDPQVALEWRPEWMKWTEYDIRCTEYGVHSSLSREKKEGGKSKTKRQIG